MPYGIHIIYLCFANELLMNLMGGGGGGLRWRSRQNKRLSPLSSWVRFSLRTRVKRVSQRSAESRGFSPGALVSFHRES
jgi:hypothetical protein